MKKLLLTVSAIALLAAACNQPSPVQQNTPTPSPTPTQQTDQSANLKTYINAKYGFEFTYDSNTYTFSDKASADKNEIFRLTDIKSAQESAKCQCGEVAVLIVSAYPNSQNLSLETFAKNNFTGTSHVLVNLQSKTFIGTQMITWGEMDSYRLFAHNGNMFLIKPASGFDDVINTFKFTK